MHLVLSLFSIVRFPNSACTGTNSYNGTCLTTSECSSYGGTASGSCASGFGVCCIGNKLSCEISSLYRVSHYLLLSSSLLLVVFETSYNQQLRANCPVEQHVLAKRELPSIDQYISAVHLVRREIVVEHLPTQVFISPTV